MKKTFKTELGTVILIDDPEDSNLLGIVPRESAVDFEWIPRRDSEIATIQIAFFESSFLHYVCLVFREWDHRLMKNFLSDPAKSKVIASKLSPSASDFKKLNITFGKDFYDDCGFVSLQSLAEKKGYPVGLGKLCAAFDLEYQELDYHLHRKWESVWSEEEEKVMVRYAAHDAFLALVVYARLQKIANPTREKDVFPCRILMKNGACNRTGCPFSHALMTCDKCNVVCTNELGWKNHINGRKHQETLKSIGQEYKSEFYCTDCNRNFSTDAALAFHLKSIEHKKTIRVLKFVKSKEISQADKDGFSVSAESVFDLGVISSPDQTVLLSFVIESKHSVDGYLTDFAFTNKDSDWYLQLT